MTREEAKKRLEVWLKCGECPEDKRCYDKFLHSTCEYTDYCDDVSIEESIKVAIEALKQEPCDDCISRQAAIDAIWDGINMDIYTREVKEILEALPPVTVKEVLFNEDVKTYDNGKFDGKFGEYKGGSEE